MSDEPLYELRDVRRIYRTGGGEVRALDGIDATIGRGEFLAVEGPSGSGKSTLLQLLGGLDRPTSGSLLFDGRELGELDNRALTRVRCRDIGFVFQAFNLIPTLSAAENVEAAMVPLEHDGKKRRARAADLLDRVGLANRASHLPSLLSGGEQQRVAIARALANEPRVILADEPTGNLDSTTADEVVSVLRTLSVDNGVTVIIVTHARDVAERTPYRIRLRDGRVIDTDTVDAASFAATSP
jgi:putative ABC transport system ATP-binding protein